MIFTSFWLEFPASPHHSRHSATKIHKGRICVKFFSDLNGFKSKFEVTDKSASWNKPYRKADTTYIHQAILRQDNF